MAPRIVTVKYISYHCHATDRAAVSRFVDVNEGTLVAEYVEGKKKWPRLLEAIEHCRRVGETLVIWQTRPTRTEFEVPLATDGIGD